MLPLPTAWTHEKGLPKEARIPGLWDTSIPFINGTYTETFCLSLPLTWSRGTSISPMVQHRHQLFHKRAREASEWVEVWYMAHRPGLRGPKGVFTPLHLRLSLQISHIYKVCFYSRSQGQEYCFILACC